MHEAQHAACCMCYQCSAAAPPPTQFSMLSVPRWGSTPSARPRLLQILGKCEFLNPGGSVKDRVAAEVVQEALASGQLVPGGLITEGTAGSTGVSLAMVAQAVGCRCDATAGPS